MHPHILAFPPTSPFSVFFSVSFSSHQFWNVSSPNTARFLFAPSNLLVWGYQVFSSIQWLSHVQLFATPWTALCQSPLSITNSWSLLKLMSIESVMPSNHLILCHSLLHLPSIFPSIRVFSNESVLCMRWPKYWSLNFSISPSDEYSGVVFFRMDWLDLLEVQGTLKSLLQHHSSKASILHCSVFFIVQLSHPYMTTGNIKALPRWIFVNKVMSLLFNMLSRLVITFLPRSKSWWHINFLILQPQLFSWAPYSYNH